MSFDALFAEAELDPQVPTLDVHGLSVTAANYEIDFFLDQLFSAGEKVGRIIHGKGAGVLQVSTKEFLKTHQQVLALHQSLKNEEMGAVVYVAVCSRV